MSDSLYNTELYARFNRDLQRRLDGPNIKDMSLDDLREPAVQTGTQTKFGSWGWRSAVSSRIAEKTVNLGSEKTREYHISDTKRKIIAAAPAELDKVLHLMETLPFVRLRRQMGKNPDYNPKCNLYVSVADLKNYRLAYMWGHTMGPVTKAPGPEFTLIHIPEEHHLRQQALVLADYNLTLVLGSDYLGEDKKAFLRNGMYAADAAGMLGLHAGTKVVTVRDPRTNKLKTYGVFLFGLSATGKSTWSCHQLGLDWPKGERTLVCQDDICFLKNDGSALGSEANFFVKTDVDKKLQEALHHALVHKSALYENVMVGADGRPDFLDENLCGNGRAVIMKKQLKIKRGRGPFSMKDIWYPSYNLPPLDELDGLVLAFITRRNTIMAFAQRLTPMQAVLAYLWGESSHSYASNPAKAGESVRIVGTDPFIVGSRARRVNHFYNIIMDLVNNYPDKVSFYQYNTGGMGEIIEPGEKGSKKKIIRKTERVPIDTMAAIHRGDLRGTNQYRPSFLATEEIVSAEGADLSPYVPEKYYSRDQIDDYLRDLVNGRRKFTEKVIEEGGLNPDVIRAAEESYGIAPEKETKVFLPVKKKEPPAPKEKPIAKLTDWKPNPRLTRDRGWRYG